MPTFSLPGLGPLVVEPPLAVLILFVASLAIWAKVAAWISVRRGIRFEIIEAAEARSLVVVVDGFRGGPWRIRDVSARARHAYPGAEVLLPVFAAGSMSNVSPYEVADVLERKIGGMCQDRASRHLPPYETIVLIGFSMGSLMLRKAFVWGHGGHLTADRPGGSTPRQSWVDQVGRIVLLAGTNRGWSVSRRGDDNRASRPMRLDRRLSILLGKPFGRILNTGRLIRSFERGSPFVADLRVQWIDLARRAPGPGASARLPMVVQLLSTIDDVVSVADNADVAASKDFIYVPLPAGGHLATIQVGPTWKWWERKRREERCKILDLGLAGDEASLKAGAIDPGRVAENPAVREVIFLMHGIRDVDFWTSKIHEELDRSPGREARHVIRASYGRFPMGPFLLLGSRQRNVRWFMDEYTEAKALFPQAEVSYLGHSNGTYLLASAMERYRTIRVKRVLFAGSVVRTRYDWGSLLPEGGSGRVRMVRNIVANNDLVVGIFPRFFEWITELGIGNGRGFFDLGSAGFNGFTQRELNVQFVAGSHSAALRPGPEKIQALAAFFAAERDHAAASILTRTFSQPGVERPFGTELSSNLCWVWWVLIAGFLLGVGMLLVTKTDFLGLSAPLEWMLYAALILLVLNSV